MKLTLRMRITLLTGVLIIIAATLLTFVSIYTAENKIYQFATEAAELTVQMHLIDINQGADGNYFVSQSAIDAVPFSEIQHIESLNAPSPSAKTIDATMLSAAYSTPAKTASQEFSYISLGVMLVITIVGMLISYYLAGKALKPVHELNRAVLNISEDNLKERLPESNKNDEISSLTCSFNSMLDRLEESFWRQKRFSSNAAHELKTPLATMKTGIQVLEISDTPTTEEYKEILDITAKNINRLTSLVDDLLVLTNEGYQDENVALPLNHLLSELVEELAPICGKNQINIEFVGTDESFVIKGNETLTYRLFYNLIENAIKYNKPHGTIKISVVKLLSNEGNSFTVSIEDTGVGIENHKLKQIFEPFYCVDPSRSRKLGGAGLGLSIVSDIADRYGWKIKVDSTKEIGTIFQVTIPVSIDL